MHTETYLSIVSIEGERFKQTLDGAIKLSIMVSDSSKQQKKLKGADLATENELLSVGFAVGVRKKAAKAGLQGSQVVLILSTERSHHAW